jgi:hypothetical protein
LAAFRNYRAASNLSHLYLTLSAGMLSAGVNWSIGSYLVSRISLVPSGRLFRKMKFLRCRR